MDETNTATAPPPNLETKHLQLSAEHIAMVREGVLALQSGDRQRAYQIFSDLSRHHYEDENVWIGLARSSDDRDEALSAVLHAALINPNSKFVKRAREEIAQRWPKTPPVQPQTAAPPPTRGLDPAPKLTKEAANKPATPAPVNELASRPTVLTSKPKGRILANIGRFLASIALLGATGTAIAAVGLGLMNSNVFMSFVAKTPVVLTVEPTLQPPIVVEPPTMTPVGAVETPADAGITDLGLAITGDAEERAAAIIAVREGRFAAAIPVLELVTSRNPTDGEALYYLGIAYMGSPDRPNAAEDAILAFRSLVEVMPDWAPGHYMLALSYLAVGRFEEAITPAIRATELDPDRAEYWMALASAYDGTGATAQADAARQQAALSSPAIDSTPAPSGGIANLPVGTEVAPLGPTATAVVADLTPELPTPELPAATATLTPVPVPSGVPGENGGMTVAPDDPTPTATPTTEVMVLGTPSPTPVLEFTVE